MHILLTNDNGYQASVLPLLAQALRVFGKVTVLAPEKDWSDSGAIGRQGAMKVRISTLTDGLSAIVCEATPSDCVSYGLMGFLSQKVDLVVSAVNVLPMEQHHLGYSAGVTAVTEALMLGIPGLAVSMPVGFGEPQWETAVEMTCHMVQRLINEGLPPHRFYNVQVPSGRARGIADVEQDLRVYYEQLATRQELMQAAPIPAFINAASVVDGGQTAVLARGHILVTSLRIHPIASQALSLLSANERRAAPSLFEQRSMQELVG